MKDKLEKFITSSEEIKDPNKVFTLIIILVSIIVFSILYYVKINN